MKLHLLLREMRNKNGLRGPRPEPSGTDGEYQDSCFKTKSGEREGGRCDVIIEIENNIKLTLPSFSFSVW